MLEIIKMRDCDLENVVFHENLLFEQSLGFDMLEKELHENPLAYYFVLLKDEKFAGYCGTWFTDPNSQIINFFIVPEFHGMKLGSYFLDFIIEFLRLKNANLITLEVNINNLIAQNLYVKKGFKKTFIRPGYYQNGDDAIMMMKYL